MFQAIRTTATKMKLELIVALTLSFLSEVSSDNNVFKLKDGKLVSYSVSDQPMSWITAVRE